MANKVHALLVGINDYSPNVGRLHGCINDADNFRDFLSENFAAAALRMEILKDADATRENVIDLFRSHLSNADRDDVVVFSYSGHGARCKAAREFREFYPDGWDEGLVLHDSREPGGFDLADKELAVLLAEIARNQPHIAVILDSCHSESTTRSVDDFVHARVRQTHEILEERPLESYLDGHYSKLSTAGNSLEIPASRHILLSACQRTQKAQETIFNDGLFSRSLLKVLRNSGAGISYADLFTRCRAVVRKKARNQEPHFETYRGFDAYAGFLGGEMSRTRRHYSVYRDGDKWLVDCGAIHGLPTDPEKSVEFALYDTAGESPPAGRATTILVGAQKSSLELQAFEPDAKASYRAEITSLPVPALAVAVTGEAAGIQVFRDSLETAEDRSYGFEIVEEDASPRYEISAENDSYLLRSTDTERLIQGVEGQTAESAEYMFGIIRRVAAWERAARLQNQATKMNPEDVGFRMVELLDEGQMHAYPGDDITIDICRNGDDWTWVTGKLKGRNLSTQPLYLLLVHFSEEYGITPFYSERVEPTEEEFTITFNGESTFTLALEDHEGDEAVHLLKLIVSTEKVDDFLLAQEPLKIGQVSSPVRSRGLTSGSRNKVVHKDEWFTKDLRIRLVRQVDRVSESDTVLANGAITIKGSGLQAEVSVGTARSSTRSAGIGTGPYSALELNGLEMLNFATTRGDNQNVLELSDIRNPEAIETRPLEIELDVGLAENEYVLPIAFDGEHFLLTGEPAKDDQGRAMISINHIPDIPDNRRSVGKALKLYFFKTWLNRDNVNKLCWVDYGDDGSAERHEDGVAEKVADANNIILLIHGITGDTQGIADCLPNIEGQSGAGLNEDFDLVLTYDYENLNTPIGDTALALKSQLRDVGLHEHDDKRLTLLVHSMGGLVSRSFIEQEGGNSVVDHLVMCGTPNVGSPFGKVDRARNLSHALTALAINSFPAAAPFGSVLLYLLNRSKKLTRCLEQMNPSSDFIKALNASDDPRRAVHDRRRGYSRVRRTFGPVDCATARQDR